MQEISLDATRRRIAWEASACGLSLPDVMDAVLAGPQVHNELFSRFFRRLGAAWKGFWRDPDEPEATTQTKQTQAPQQDMTGMLEKQAQVFATQLKVFADELKKVSGDKASEKELYEKMMAAIKPHLDNVKSAIDSGDKVDKALAARSGGVAHDGPLPVDPGEAWDALQTIPGIARSDALNRWWDALPETDKVKTHALLGVKFPLERVQGRLLSKSLEDARAAGKI